MNARSVRLLTMIAVMAVVVAVVGAQQAEARAGGGRSVGSRGSRSYSPPSRTYSQPAPARPAAPPPYQPTPMAQPQGGGFFRSMAGGVVGGLLGGMLFRGLGFGGGYGAGGLGGSGIGLFEIILLAGIGYLIYRMVKGRRQESPAYPAGYDAYRQAEPSPSTPDLYPAPGGAAAAGTGDLEQGMAHIRQMDASFDEGRFQDTAMDIFFRIQGAWMNRDLAPVSGLLADEMRKALQEDVERLIREKRVNRLENIAVRSVEIVEAWQESGDDFVTVLFTANLLDYTTDDATGQVVAGSRTEPVKFQEYWTFRRPVGPNPWRLSAIDQG